MRFMQNLLERVVPVWVVATLADVFSVNRCDAGSLGEA